MLSSFTIDTKELSAEFNLRQRQVDNLLSFAVKKVASDYQKLWEDEANVLGATRRQYKQSIRRESRGNASEAVYMNPTAWLPNALEIGFPAFDMKIGMLNSRKAKTGKDGKRYLIIPFRFGAPTSLAENEVFSGKLPSSIHEVAKSTGKPVKMNDIPSEYHIPQSAELRNAIKSLDTESAKKAVEGQAMTSIYEGVQKRGGVYMNFRVVSDNSPSERFMHPGFEARELSDKALRKLDIPMSVDQSIDNFLSNLGF